MEYCVSYGYTTITPTVKSLPSPSQVIIINKSHQLTHNTLLPHSISISTAARRSIISRHSLTAAGNSSNHRRFGPIISGSGYFGKRRRFLASAGASPCEFSGLNVPLEPRSEAGKLLSGVLQNRRELFHGAVAEQLKRLGDGRDAAIARVRLSSGSTEAGLYRRIAEVEQREGQIAIEDVMYMLILYNFSEIRVHLVPKLSKCIYKGRLEICPSNVWDLESIHSVEVLEMVREHLTTVIGLRANSSVRDEWATTQIHRLQLSRVYAASILYGYFLKSACLRHRMELSLSLAHQDCHLAHKLSLPFSEFLHHGLNNLGLGGFSNRQPMALGQGSIMQGRDLKKLRFYVMGFDPDTLQQCAKLKSVEAMNLVEKHTWGLFGNGKTDSLETDEVISTSFTSLKRLVLEAVAFGSFLWEAERYVDTLYKLKDN